MVAYVAHGPRFLKTLTAHALKKLANNNHIGILSVLLAETVLVTTENPGPLPLRSRIRQSRAESAAAKSWTTTPWPRLGRFLTATVVGQEHPLLLAWFPLVRHQVIQYDCYSEQILSEHSASARMRGMSFVETWPTTSVAVCISLGFVLLMRDTHGNSFYESRVNRISGMPHFSEIQDDGECQQVNVKMLGDLFKLVYDE